MPWQQLKWEDVGKMVNNVSTSSNFTCMKGALVHLLFTSHQGEEGGLGDACCESPGGADFDMFTKDILANPPSLTWSILGV